MAMAFAAMLMLLWAAGPMIFGHRSLRFILEGNRSTCRLSGDRRRHVKVELTLPRRAPRGQCRRLMAIRTPRGDEEAAAAPALHRWRIPKPFVAGLPKAAFRFFLSRAAREARCRPGGKTV